MFISNIFNNTTTKTDEIRDLLIAMHQRGETVSEIIAFLQFLEEQKIGFLSPISTTFDICGTGGSGKQRINLSTALAIKLSAQFSIAKHGNKASSGRVGSFDLLFHMGLETAQDPVSAKEQLREQRLSFLYAPAFHPALGAVAEIRRSIPHRTIFNYLGPLLNPVNNLTGQMIGCSDPVMMEKLAEAAAYLGKNALFVHDMEFGLDDVSIGGETYAIEVVNGQITSKRFTPEDYGITRVDSFADIAGGTTPAENAQIFTDLLNGTASQAHADFLEMNRLVAQEFFDQLAISN